MVLFEIWSLGHTPFGEETAEQVGGTYSSIYSNKHYSSRQSFSQSVVSTLVSDDELTVAVIHVSLVFPLTFSPFAPSCPYKPACRSDKKSIC